MSSGLAAIVTAVSVGTLIAVRAPLPAGLSGLVQTELAVLAAWVLGIWARDRRRQLETAEDRAGRLEAEREERDRQAVAEERERIARELHDVVTHHVSVIVIQAGAAERALDRRPADVREAHRGDRLDRPAGARRHAPDARDPGPAGGRRAPAATRRRPRTDARPRPARRAARAGPRGGHAGRAGRHGRAAGARPGHRAVRLSDHPGGADERPQARTRRTDPGRASATARLPSTSRSTTTAGGDRRRRRRRRAVGGSGRGLIGMRERVAVFGGEFAAGPTGRGFRVTATPAARRGRGEREATASASCSSTTSSSSGPGFRMILADEPDIEVDRRGDGRQARRSSSRRRLEPDVIVMDIRMPIMDGVEATRRIVADAARPEPGPDPHDVRRRRVRRRGAPGGRQRVRAQGRPARRLRRRRSGRSRRATRCSRRRSPASSSTASATGCRRRPASPTRRLARADRSRAGGPEARRARAVEPRDRRPPRARRADREDPRLARAAEARPARSGPGGRARLRGRPRPAGRRPTTDRGPAPAYVECPPVRRRRPRPRDEPGAPIAPNVAVAIEPADGRRGGPGRDACGNAGRMARHHRSNHQ